MLRVVVVMVVLGLMFAAPSSAGATTPLGAWPTTTPEEQHLDSAQLTDALLMMQQTIPHLHSFLVVSDGKLVIDASFYPYDGTTPHDLASVTKSITTTLIGIAIDQGKLRLDQPLLSFFPDRTIANNDERKQRVTVANLASMTSGLDCVWQPDEPTLQEMEASTDWVQFALDLPMIAEPGSRWEYCSPGMHLLSAILTKATGKTALDFAWESLFGPLGMREAIWPADPQGNSRGWGGLRLHPRDAAKLGQLWLTGGSWNGRQVVSRAWTDAAVTASVATTVDGMDYGYGWWINRESTVGPEFSARGRGGQFVEIFPAFNAVLVMTGSGTFEPGVVTDLLAPALIDPTTAPPPNPDGVARLKATIASLGAVPDPLPVPSLPETAHAMSGKIYQCEPNPLEIATVQLVFDGSTEAVLTMTFQGIAGPITMPVGLDGIFRISPGDYGLPLGLRGAWTDERTFVLDYDTIANNEAVLVQLSFQGNTVAIMATERTHEQTFQFKGSAAE